MLDTFYFNAFIADDIKLSEGSPIVARTSISYFYCETTTNQCPDGRYRPIYLISGGKIVRAEELHDSPYMKAFAKLVKARKEARRWNGLGKLPRCQAAVEPSRNNSDASP